MGYAGNSRDGACFQGLPGLKIIEDVLPWKGVWPLGFYPLHIGGAVALWVLPAARSCNRLHLVALPLAQVSTFAGYVGGLVARAQGKR